jgi:hypothetical protein
VDEATLRSSGWRVRAAFAAAALAVVLAAAIIFPAGGAAAATAHAVTWCGTPSDQDQLPDALAGPQFHVVYAVPADGQDRFAQLAPAIASDLAAIDSWWRAQDNSRTIRFDTTSPNACGSAFGALDISRVRLPRAGAEYQDIAGRPSLITADLQATGGPRSSYKKYLIYYDGPSGSEDICGQGSFIGDAYVYLNRPHCGTVGAAEWPAVTAAHEMIHAMGALARPPSGPGPPHACPGDPAHPCDNGSDVLAGQAAQTYSASLYDRVLDYGRDDYYGHAGSWPDVRNSPFLTQLDAQATLNVHLAGPPGNSVFSEPGSWADCDNKCTTTWNAGTMVTLLVRKGDQSRFIGWTGACSGTDLVCSFPVTGTTEVTAVFGPLQRLLRVKVIGAGRVSSTSSGLMCPKHCSVAADLGTTFALRASAARGFRFVGWSNGCSGRRPTCNLQLGESDLLTVATFHRTK